MTAVKWEQEDEEVGLIEKEMIAEASVTPGRLEVSRLNRSARLSEEGEKKTPISEQEHVIQSKLTGFEMY